MTSTKMGPLCFLSNSRLYFLEKMEINRKIKTLADAGICLNYFCFFLTQHWLIPWIVKLQARRLKLIMLKVPVNTV